LRNVVERLMLLASEDGVTLATVRSALPTTPTSLPSSGASSGALAEQVQIFEREAILAELRRSNFNITNAARSLGLERSHLYKKAEQLGIDIQKQRREEETDAT